jgi:hypothetical protein
MPESREALTYVDAHTVGYRVLSIRSTLLLLKALQQFPQALRAKGANPAFMELAGQG